MEIGAGRSGLAALSLAKEFQRRGQGAEVSITDGNAECIPFLNQNIRINDLISMKRDRTNAIEMRAFPLLFGDFKTITRGYDLVLASDVLFFESFHEDLIGLLRHCLDLKSGARVVMVNKERGESQKRFLEKLKAYEDLKIREPVLIGSEKIYSLIEISKR